MGSFMGTSLRMLIHKMAYGELDFVCLIVGVVVGVLMIVALMYRLCCYKNRIPTEETITVQNLRVSQVDVIRIPPTEASSS